MAQAKNYCLTTKTINCS